MKFKLIIILIGLLLLSGCGGITNRQLFVFEDMGSLGMNEQWCFNLCQLRESSGYTCDYDPVICDGEECICRTW